LVNILVSIRLDSVMFDRGFVPIDAATKGHRYKHVTGYEMKTNSQVKKS